MGILDRFLGKKDNIEEQIQSESYGIAECSYECDSCTNKFPSSVKVSDEKLWNSTGAYGLHLVVATGKTDWSHDACLTKGTVAHETAGWAQESNGKVTGLGNSEVIKVSTSSLMGREHETNDEYMEERRGDILVMPFFVWLRNVRTDQVKNLLSEAIPKLVTARNDHQELPKSIEGFKDVSIEADNFQSYIFLCSHKTRDKRCGITAPIMKKEFDIHLRDLNLLRDAGDDRPDGVNVAFVNHVGGHKYAANVIIYTRSGSNIWLGRCTPKNAKPIIDECVLNNKVWPESIRLIQRFKKVEW